MFLKFKHINSLNFVDFCKKIKFLYSEMLYSTRIIFSVYLPEPSALLPAAL